MFFFVIHHNIGIEFDKHIQNRIKFATFVLKRGTSQHDSNVEVMRRVHMFKFFCKIDLIDV